MGAPKETKHKKENCENNRVDWVFSSYSSLGHAQMVAPIVVNLIIFQGTVSRWLAEFGVFTFTRLSLQNHKQDACDTLKYALN